MRLMYLMRLASTPHILVYASERVQTVCVCRQRRRQSVCDGIGVYRLSANVNALCSLM